MRISLRFALAVLLLIPAAARAQTVKGAAILQHPLGVLTTKSVDAIAAGKLDEYQALRIKDDQDEWKKMSAADKRDYGARLKERVPAPAVVAGLVRQGGELTITGDSATLLATTEAGMLRQVFMREGGQWRVSFGPMFIATPKSAPPVEITGAELSKHPAVAVVLQYNDLVQAGRMAEAMTKFGSASAQKDWNAMPASEKTASAAFRKSLFPARAELTRAIGANGTLTIESGLSDPDVKHGFLNIITIQPATSSNGGRGSSTTLGVPLELENGVWKIAQ